MPLCCKPNPKSKNPPANWVGSVVTVHPESNHIGQPRPIADLSLCPLSSPLRLLSIQQSRESLQTGIRPMIKAQVFLVAHKALHNLSMFPPCPRLLSLSLTYCVLATRTSSLFFQHARHSPDPEPLHRLLLWPGVLYVAASTSSIVSSKSPWHMTQR